MSDDDATHMPVDTGIPIAASKSTLVAPIIVSPLMLEVHGREQTFLLPIGDRPIVRQRLREIARREKSFAARAGNAANTAQQLAIGVGAALAVGGGIALATVAAPVAIGAAALTGAGVLITCGGMIASHLFTIRRIEHEQRADRFIDTSEELK